MLIEISFNSRFQIKICHKTNRRLTGKENHVFQKNLILLNIGKQTASQLVKDKIKFESVVTMGFPDNFSISKETRVNTNQKIPPANLKIQKVLIHDLSGHKIIYALRNPCKHLPSTLDSRKNFSSTFFYHRNKEGKAYQWRSINSTQFSRFLDSRLQKYPPPR